MNYKKEEGMRLITKKIIYFIGILFITIVLLINLIFTAKMDISEAVSLEYNNFFYLIGVILFTLLLFYITNKLDKLMYKDDSEKTIKMRKIIFIISIVMYIIVNIIWVIAVRPPIVGDQIHACNLAQTFYRNNLDEFLHNLTYAGIPLSEYMQAYHQQISLAFVFSMFFRIIHFDGIGVLRALNVIGNIAIVFALYKLNVQLSKKYKTNKVRLLFIILTFVSLIMLNTFIYGDTPSIALCLWAVYFMMKWIETDKIKYPIFATIFTMIAYMMRMNSLIFIIATVIYLLLSLINNIRKRTIKENIIKVGVILLYVIISILPTSLVQNYYIHKYNLDGSKEYPMISYLYMAMEESWRGNGWYNEDIGEPALREPEIKKEEYKEKIKERLQYFIENPIQMLKFYTGKIASMWAETTYSQVRSNMVDDDYWVKDTEGIISFYQKALTFLIFRNCTYSANTK